jgi:hypothetical protein
MHEGLDNAARIAVLEEGMQYRPLSFSHKDSQWLESRAFQRTDVAGWFNLPPHKLGDLKDANYSNMVEKNRDYLSTGLMRWLVKWQDEFTEKLLGKREKETDSHFYEFNLKALLQGDVKSRNEAYGIALGGHPYMTINEIRGAENMNAVEGGDEVPKPLNMSSGQEEGGEAADDETGNKVTAKAAELLKCEANRVCHAAKTAKNFVGWLDSFYDRWPETLAESLPITDTAILLDWCNRHKAECLEAAGRVPEQAQLVARLAAVTAVWPMYATNLSIPTEG